MIFATEVVVEAEESEKRRVRKLLLVMVGILFAGIVVTPCVLVGAVAIWEQLATIPVVWS